MKETEKCHHFLSGYLILKLKIRKQEVKSFLIDRLFSNKAGYYLQQKKIACNLV